MLHHAAQVAGLNLEKTLVEQVTHAVADGSSGDAILIIHVKHASSLCTYGQQAVLCSKSNTNKDSDTDNHSTSSNVKFTWLHGQETGIQRRHMLTYVHGVKVGDRASGQSVHLHGLHLDVMVLPHRLPLGPDFKHLEHTGAK